MEKFLALIPSNIKKLPPWLIIATLSWLAYEQNRTAQAVEKLTDSLSSYGTGLSVMQARFEEHLRYSTYILRPDDNTRAN